MRTLIITLILLFFAASAAAQSYGQRAVAIAEAIKGSALTAQNIEDLSLAFAKHYPQHFNPADPANPTQAEYAECLVLSQREHFLTILEIHAERDKSDELQSQVQAAGDAARAVIEQ